MKKRLLIIGAGGLGREVFSYIHSHPSADYSLAGFLNDDPDALATFDLPFGIVGPIKDYQPKPDEVLLPAIGNPGTKLTLCRDLQQRGAQFANYIHPSAIVGYAVKLGTGIFVFPGAIIGPWATVGNFASGSGSLSKIATRAVVAKPSLYSVLRPTRTTRLRVPL